MERKSSKTLFVFIVIAFFIFPDSITFAQDLNKGRDKNMGYCFDAAFDPAQKRLFVVGGIAGLHGQYIGFPCHREL